MKFSPSFHHRKQRDSLHAERPASNRDGADVNRRERRRVTAKANHGYLRRMRGFMTERIETSRTIGAPAPDVFAVLCDPQGHVAIDSSGMLQDAEGDPVTGVGDSFVVHMDRESLNDFPQLGKYDVTVNIKEFEKDRLISWTILGQIRPQIGHVYGYLLEPADDGASTVVTSFYDWSNIDPKWRDAGIFPVLSESALRATLGILDRTVRRGYPRA
jgi:polyketide cyclase/dehydrase/lipid transport protein